MRVSLTIHVYLCADVGRIALGICYDIRFPEMAMLYAARGTLSLSHSSLCTLRRGVRSPTLNRRCLHMLKIPEVYDDFRVVH